MLWFGRTAYQRKPNSVTKRNNYGRTSSGLQDYIKLPFGAYAQVHDDVQVQSRTTGEITLAQVI
jgi:hypothetical protein